MKVLLVVLTIFWMNPVFAQDLKPEILIYDKPQPLWRHRHPRMYKIYRGARAFCLKTEFMVRYCGHLSNIATPIVIEVLK